MGNRNDQLAARRAAAVAGYELHTDRPDIGVQIYWKPLNGDQILAQCFIGKAGKPAWFYRFRNMAELETHIARQIDNRTKSLEVKSAYKQARNAEVEVKIGDVFRASWGYDQTNIDYYQVTRIIGAKTVEVRKISAISWGTEYMQGRSVPDTDNFVGRPMVKRVKNAGRNRASIRIASYCDAYQMEPVIEGTPLYESSAWTAYA